jgi:hypothetical protein
MIYEQNGITSAVFQLKYSSYGATPLITTARKNILPMWQ